MSERLQVGFEAVVFNEQKYSVLKGLRDFDGYQLGLSLVSEIMNNEEITSLALVGEPGIGKSTYLGQLAEVLERKQIICIPNTHDIALAQMEDILGKPRKYFVSDDWDQYMHFFSDRIIDLHEKLKQINQINTDPKKHAIQLVEFSLVIGSSDEFGFERSVWILEQMAKLSQADQSTMDREATMIVVLATPDPNLQLTPPHARDKKDTANLREAITINYPDDSSPQELSAALKSEYRIIVPELENGKMSVSEFKKYIKRMGTKNNIQDISKQIGAINQEWLQEKGLTISNLPIPFGLPANYPQIDDIRLRANFLKNLLATRVQFPSGVARVGLNPYNPNDEIYWYPSFMQDDRKIKL